MAAAKRFLEEHPEEILRLATAKIKKPGRVNAQLVKEFLGWKHERVLDCLERLGMMERGDVEPEAIRKLPAERAARDFVKAVKVRV